MSDPRRQLLLELYAMLVTLPEAEQPAAAIHRAAASGTVLRWQGALSEPPHRSAVRVAHSLGMGAPGLQLWRADWNAQTGSAPVAQLGLHVARLLAGREDLLLLAGRCGGVAGHRPGAGEIEEGVLVDGNSCARMAVAGLDVETELKAGRTLALLEAAGDLLHGGGHRDGVPGCLLIGLKMAEGALAAGPRPVGS